MSSFPTFRFHEDLAKIAEAQNMAASLPHHVSPESGFVHASLGVLANLVRKAHALHVSGNTMGAVDLIDPSANPDWKNELTQTPHDDEGYHPYPGSAWRLGHGDSMHGIVQNIDYASQTARSQVAPVSPIHVQTLETIRDTVRKLSSLGYRGTTGLKPSDWENFGDEDDPQGLRTPGTITIMPKTESPEIGHTPRQVGR